PFIAPYPKNKIKPEKVLDQAKYRHIKFAPINWPAWSTGKWETSQLLSCATNLTTYSTRLVS
ncbi:TPA: hypothetical protein ACRMZM_006003, partial [Pseudomonas aeruginosa]